MAKKKSLKGKQKGPRILVVRLSAIGDVVMASPLVGAIKKSWSGARVTWLVERISAPLLQYHPDLDEVIVWPRDEWRLLLRRGRLLKLFADILSFVRELRLRQFTIALDVQGLLKSGIWAFLSGAKRRIGVGSREGSRLLMTEVLDRADVEDRISSQYFLLAQKIGLDTTDFRMVLEVGDEAQDFARKFAANISSGYAILCPFTTRPQKEWIPERFNETAHRLIEERGLATIILGGPADIDSALGLLPENEPRAFSMAGKTSLLEAAALIKHASLVIGVDTGLTHMGIALEVPTVALFGATVPYLNTEGTSGIVIYHPIECSPCRRNPTCDGLFPCMRAITVDEVMETAHRLLNKGQTSQ